MDYSEDLDCRIYVDANCTLNELVSIIANSLSGLADMRTVQTPHSEIDVVDNDKFDEKRRRDFPGGFNYFRYSVEIYPLVGLPHIDRVALVADLLKYFWSQNWPAVAVCDYEQELPNNGGYKSPSTPWP